MPSKQKVIALVIATIFFLSSIPMVGFMALLSEANEWEKTFRHTPPQQSNMVFSGVDINLVNGNFTADTGSTGFASLSASEWNTEGTPTNLVNGVVNVRDWNRFLEEKYETSTPLFINNPWLSNGNDDNVLIIANQTEQGSASFGYISNTFELHRDGYFIIEVDFYAVHGNGGIYLRPTTSVNEDIRTDIQVRQLLPQEQRDVPPLYPMPEGWTPGLGDPNLLDNNDLPGIEDLPDYGFWPWPTGAITEWPWAPSLVNEVALNRSVWQTATFLVRTDQREDMSFQIGLFLGTMEGGQSRGVVFYDNVRIRSLNRELFVNEMTEIDKDLSDLYTDWLDDPITENFDAYWNMYETRSKMSEPYNNGRVVDFRGYSQVNHFGLLDEYKISLENFSSNSDDANDVHQRMIEVGLVPDRGALNFIKDENLEEDDEENRVTHFHAFDGAGLNQKVMMFAAANGRASMKLDEQFTIERNIVYMLSFYSLNNGSANLRIYDVNIEEDDPDVPHFDSGYNAIHSAETPALASRNQWVLNTFFIYGHPLRTIDVNIEFWIGTEDGDAATGWLVVDQFSIVRVSNEYFTSHNEGVNATRIDSPTLEAAPGAQNGAFNFGTVRSAMAPFPLIADDWTLSIPNPEHEPYVMSGIVNTDSLHWGDYAFKSGNYPWEGSPGAVVEGGDANNNIYMMRNTDMAYQKLTSQTIPLSASADVWTIISFNYATIYGPSTGIDFYASIELAGREIARIDLSKEAPGRIVNSSVEKGFWDKASVAIKNSEFTSREVTISFMLGSSENKPGPASTAFIDNVDINESENYMDSNEIVDLTNPINIIMFGTTRESLVFVPKDADLATTAIWPNRLEISSNGYQNTSVESTLAEELSNGSFFELRVRASIAFVGGHPFEVITQYVEEGDDYQIGLPIDEPDDVDYGVNLTFTNFDGGFYNLKPDRLRSMNTFDNGFVDFLFYIRSDSTLDLALVIEFGNEWRRINAVVTITEMVLKTMDEPTWRAAYEAQEAMDEDDLLYTNIAMVTEPEYEHEEDDGGETGGGGDENGLHFLVIPSIIMGIALLFALAMLLLRKFKFNKHITQTHTSYAQDDAGVKGATEIIAKEVKQPKIKKKDDETPKTE